MSMPQVRLTEDRDRTHCHHVPADEWKALLTVARYNGWGVQACGLLPGDALRRGNAGFRVPWSGGRTMGDGDRMSATEAQGMADAIEAAAELLVGFLRETQGSVTIEAVDLGGGS